MPKKPRISKVQSKSSAHDVPTGAEAAYGSFLSEADALAERDVLPFRTTDVSLLVGNVSAGASAILAHRTEVEASLPTVDLDRVASLSQLALAVVFAAAQVDRSNPSSGAIKKLLVRANALRNELLDAARPLANAGLLSKAKLEAIEKGRGPRDKAQDCVDLAALFRGGESKIKGKTTVAKAQWNEADEVGSQLLTLLRSGRAKDAKKKPPPPELTKAIATRDRMWTLLSRDHDHLLRRPGFYLFGEADVDAHVPALQAHHARKKKAKKNAPAAAATGTGGA